jgi:hypothetical protein
VSTDPDSIYIYIYIYGRFQVRGVLMGEMRGVNHSPWIKTNDI